ncbi:hypothetical protein [Nostoc sp. LEGE 12447]|nr:hypothetical protein [Nostoc sp. LEGE 12447]
MQRRNFYQSEAMAIMYPAILRRIVQSIATGNSSSFSSTPSIV